MGKIINISDIPEVNFERTHGDSFILGVSIEDKGIPVDITGATFFFTMKGALDDTDAEAVVTRDTPFERDDAAGRIEIGATASEAAALTLDQEYYYDVQMVTAAGAVQTLTKGTYTPRWGVTVRTT